MRLITVGWAQTSLFCELGPNLYNTSSPEDPEPVNHNSYGAHTKGSKCESWHIPSRCNKSLQKLGKSEDLHYLVSLFQGLCGHMGNVQKSIDGHNCKLRSGP